ncbi:MAG: 16S rRNA (cytidine(1402)-2'-O)-methyltransferase, partial [Actinomycetia bacterium]|nr:16S rRNA (cytidine(1402)-2'-O)-methyltransferase [Actinomycetes bacterium]
GHTIAQVSDAGLPGIADPGHRLIKACIENKIPIEVLPGPSAFLTAAVLSGLPTDDIHFLGYVPRKQGARKRLLSEMENSRSTLIFYESPRRLLTTLNDIDELFGDRQIFIGREMTKKFEEHLRGSAKQIGQILADRGVKGEVVIVIAGLRDKKTSFEPQQLAAEIRREVETGKSKKDAIKDVAEKHGLSRRLVYEAAHEKQDKTPTQ